MKSRHVACLMAGIVTIGLLLVTPIARADASGTFIHDDNLAQVTFTVGSGGSLVTMFTTSYADGTDGFDPILTLFNNATGYTGFSNDDNSLVGCDPETGACFDSSISTTLGAGNYTLVVSQYDNFYTGNVGDPLDPALFSRNGQGDFTGPAFCGVDGAFYDVTCDQNNGNWHVVIQGAQGTTPEPSSIALFGSGILGLAGVLRRKMKV